MNNHSLSEEYILERLQNPNKIKADRKDFWAVYEEYIFLSSTVKAKNTIKGITTAFKFLETYCLEKRIRINFEEFEPKFLREIQEVCI